jgi:hypothetical protein
MNYYDKLKDESLRLEIENVEMLKQWERLILQEVDRKYDPDDDSSDIEAIQIRAQRALKKQQEAEQARRSVEEGKQKP